MDDYQKILTIYQEISSDCKTISKICDRVLQMINPAGIMTSTAKGETDKEFEDKFRNYNQMIDFTFAKLEYNLSTLIEGFEGQTDKEKE